MLQFNYSYENLKISLIYVYVCIYVSIYVYIYIKKSQIFEQVGKILEMNKIRKLKPEIYNKKL